ncbi:hypothetical protein CIK75_04880 [Glutamicibacter sp. BW78]|uniref:CPBP family intramembrane glutamic endopeptidase n=1 Tax=Glutamicibacter sp. BW78 TaxID=2024403 RepID=UPI000BB7E7AA|nr:CPBP family intramembrane glutamic endopeptidase [Glutamicibacter sp. BW78]PCC25819.1 hypothetical protein CIK75_04880 [Glutamicibacter sp. BW78]
MGALWGAAGLLAVYGLIMVLGGYRLLTPAGVDVPGILELMLVAGLGAAVTEELAFREMGLRLLEEFAGTWTAVVVSGRVFGMFHLTNPDATLWAGIATAIEAGLLEGVSYALTRSLWVVIGYHMLWNIVQGPVWGVPISGTGKASSIWHTGLTGPEWLTGGSFGLEASVVTVILLLTSTVVLALMLRRRGGVAAPRAGGVAGELLAASAGLRSTDDPGDMVPDIGQVH